MLKKMYSWKKKVFYLIKWFLSTLYSLYPCCLVFKMVYLKNDYLFFIVNTSSESLFNSKFLTIDGDNLGFKSSSSQSSLHDHIESGYGSQIFDASTHLSPKNKVMQSYSGESLKSNHSAKSSLSSNNTAQNTLQKEDKTINLRDTLKSLNKIVKKRNSEKSAPKTGMNLHPIFSILMFQFLCYWSLPELVLKNPS